MSDLEKDSLDNRLYFSNINKGTISPFICRHRHANFLLPFAQQAIHFLQKNNRGSPPQKTNKIKDLIKIEEVFL